MKAKTQDFEVRKRKLEPALRLNSNAANRRRLADAEFPVFICLYYHNYWFFNDIQDTLGSHSTSSEQIAEPDPFKFGSNFAHVFV